MQRLSRSEVQLVRHLVSGAAPPESGPVDWDLVVRCAGYHRLGPLLFDGLQRSPVYAPHAMLERVGKMYHFELARAVVRLHLVQLLASTAERLGLEACLLKGAAFCETLYPNPAARPMSDIDVLTRAPDVESWTVELERLGFRHHETADHAISFRHRHTGVFLELHHTLTSGGDYLGVDTNALLDRSEPAGHGLRTLRPEDHLMHVCLHASFQHGFRQAAINARDAQLLVEHPRLDIARFLERARTGRTAPWIYGGLVMSHAVFPSERLALLAQELRPDVPNRLARKLSRLDAADGLLPDPRATTRTPFRRVLWAGDASATLPLLLEVLKPQNPNDRNAPSRWARRATQLIWNHCFRAIPLALMKPLQMFPRSTPASLGEVRDV